MDLEQHRDYLLACARAKFNNFTLDPEDAVQEVFYKILTTQQFEGRANIRTYLYTTLRNVYLMDNRSRGRRERYNRIFEELREAVPQPDAIAVEDQEVETLKTALASLKGTLHDAIVMHYYHGMSYDEIGEEMGVSRNAAKQRAKRGRQALFTALMRSSSGAPTAVDSPDGVRA